MCDMCEDKGWVYTDDGGGLCPHCDAMPWLSGYTRREPRLYKPIRQDGTIDWDRGPTIGEAEHAKKHFGWAVQA